MKKIILTSAITLMVFSFQAKAQETTTAATTKIGVRGGLSFSNLYTKDVDDKNMLTGLTAGIFIEAPISNNVAFQPEFNFTMKGSRIAIQQCICTRKNKIRLELFGSTITY